MRPFWAHPSERKQAFPPPKPRPCLPRLVLWTGAPLPKWLRARLAEGNRAPRSSRPSRRNAARAPPLWELGSFRPAPNDCWIYPSGSPRERRKGGCGFSEQITLQEVAAEVDERVAFLDIFDALPHHHHPHVLAERSHRPDEFLLGRLLVNVAYERHIELHDLGLEEREA